MPLTLPQHRKLDAIAVEDPGATVVGIVGRLVMADSHLVELPVVRRSDGRFQKLAPGGRLIGLRSWGVLANGDQAA